jgi:Family of unknown function (DUF5677)
MVFFGDPNEQSVFMREYASFLVEWRALQEAVKQVMLNRTLDPPDTGPVEGLPDDDPRVLAIVDKYRGDISSFVLARTAVDDFNEILVLSSNGYGIGAFKLLRGMYERIVTAEYVALFPEVTRTLVDSVWIHSMKMLNRAVKMDPNISRHIDEEDLSTLRERDSDARSRLRESVCKTCGQFVRQHAWTKVDLETMALKVDKRLSELKKEHVRLADFYLRCYLQPTGIEHATGTSINEKFRLVDGSWTYRTDSSRERRHALLFGHALILILLGFQNDYFGYGLEEALSQRWEAYRRVWNVPLSDACEAETDS